MSGSSLRVHAFLLGVLVCQMHAQDADRARIQELLRNATQLQQVGKYAEAKAAAEAAVKAAEEGASG